jgi:hypothetical protein
LIQSGYSADFILELGVDSFNGLRNQPVRLGSKRVADPEFFRLLTLLTEIQDAGAVGMPTVENTNNKPQHVVFFRDDKATPAVKESIAEVHELLGLSKNEQEFRLLSSPLPGGPGELTVGTRSLSQMLTAMALGVEVPESHAERNLTPLQLMLVNGDRTPLLRVKRGQDHPDDVYAKVQYEGG